LEHFDRFNGLNLSSDDDAFIDDGSQLTDPADRRRRRAALGVRVLLSAARLAGFVPSRNGGFDAQSIASTRGRDSGDILSVLAGGLRRAAF
jgi:hypothetical protein